ncbi:MAG: glycosyltransferase family 4 protein [Oscillospiraceae bacterium]|jgi:1,2-diacylglycerol 3-alpha-glucosyltransferase
MKVLIATDWYAPAVNGVVTSVMNLRKELMLRGHDVRVLTLSETTRSWKGDGVTYIASVGIGKLYPGARLRTSPAREYIDEIVEWRPDVIHTQCEFSTFLVARKIAAKLNIPIVHTYHTIYENYTHYFSPNKAGGRHMVAAISRWVIKQTGCVIAPSEKVRSILRGYNIDREIRVIPTGLDLGAFAEKPDDAGLSRLKRKLGIPTGNRVLLFIGRLAKEKNLEEVLNLFAALRPEHSTLLIVGDGPHKAALESLASRLGIDRDVVFTGMVRPENVADYYHLGDLFVCASGSEAQGLTYIEALAAGLPVLCRRDDCLKDIIVDGQNGWQYEDGEDFSGKLRFFMSGGAGDMRGCARLTAERKFSSTHFAEQVESAYLDAIDAAKGCFAFGKSRIDTRSTY